jgi:hypothetical protein
MLNKIVNHVKFGEGKIVEVIDRSSPTIVVDNETGEVKTVKSSLPDLVIIEFKDGIQRKFQDVALEDSNYFIKEEIKNNGEILE